VNNLADDSVRALYTNPDLVVVEDG